LTFPRDLIGKPLLNLVETQSICEATLLSTCNRTELYCHGLAEGENLLSWFSEQAQVSISELNPHFFCYQGPAAVRHIMRVACGLDSMILGEPQIAGQLKGAFSIAKEVGTIGTHLQRLFQHVFTVTKEIRSDTDIGRHPVSVSFAAVNLAKHIFNDISKRQALLIGAGESIELAAKYLHDNKIKKIIVANRTIERAAALADHFQGESIRIGDIPNKLHEADIVITATASQLPLIGKGLVERAIRTRKHNPILMIDIAVPRDIEPEVGDLDDVYLYCIDDLKTVIENGYKERVCAAKQAESMIDLHAAHYVQLEQTYESVDLIRGYRDIVLSLGDQELARALKRLDNQEDAKDILTELVNRLTNKIMHTPCVELRQASYEGDQAFLTKVQRLLGIKN